MRQRWAWIRGAGVDSGRILRFAFGPGSGPAVKKSSEKSCPDFGTFWDPLQTFSELGPVWDLFQTFSELMT